MGKAAAVLYLFSHARQARGDMGKGAALLLIAVVKRVALPHHAFRALHHRVSNSVDFAHDMLQSLLHLRHRLPQLRHLMRLAAALRQRLIQIADGDMFQLAGRLIQRPQHAAQQQPSRRRQHRQQQQREERQQVAAFGQRMQRRVVGYASLTIGLGQRGAPCLAELLLKRLHRHHKKAVDRVVVEAFQLLLQPFRQLIEALRQRALLRRAVSGEQRLRLGQRRRRAGCERLPAVDRSGLLILHKPDAGAMAVVAGGQQRDARVFQQRLTGMQLPRGFHRGVAVIHRQGNHQHAGALQQAKQSQKGPESAAETE